MADSGANGKGRLRPGALAGLFVLSSLLALSVLAPSLLPMPFSTALPPMAAQAFPLGMLAAAAGCFFWRKKAPRFHGQQFRASVWIGLGLFTVPALLIHLASGWISAFTRTALFTLVPVFAVVLDPYLGNETSRPVLSRLPVALAAVLGAVLVFPISIPTSVEATASFAAVILAAILVAAANAYAVALFQPAATQSLAPIAATGALSLGILSAALENNTWHWTAIAPELLWTAVLQLPSLWLLFWLMRRLSAVHLALRFILAPALAVPLGALLMQLPLALRTCLGLLGMAGGAVYLLLMPESEAESASLLRGADSHPDSQ